MHIYLVKPVSLRQLQKPVDMCVVAVNAAVGYQAEHMQRRIILLTVVYRVKQGRILKESAVLNLLGDPRQLLIYDTARTHIQVSYLRVAHLAFRKAHCHAAGISFHKRALRHKLIHHRRSRFRHCVAVLPVIQAVAVQDHQYCWFLSHDFLLLFFYYFINRLIRHMVIKCRIRLFIILLLISTFTSS